MLTKTEQLQREQLKENLFEINVYAPEYAETLDKIYLLNYKENNGEEFKNYYKCSKNSIFNARSSVDSDWADCMTGEI